MKIPGLRRGLSSSDKPGNPFSGCCLEFRLWVEVIMYFEERKKNAKTQRLQGSMESRCQANRALKSLSFEMEFLRPAFERFTNQASGFARIWDSRA